MPSYPMPTFKRLRADITCLATNLLLNNKLELKVALTVNSPSKKPVIALNLS